MNFRDIFDGADISASEQLKMAWWLIISTEQPRFTYYFGPFFSSAEALLYKPGYVEDLVEEGAQGFSFVVKECSPNELTIEGDLFAPNIKEMIK